MRLRPSSGESAEMYLKFAAPAGWGSGARAHLHAGHSPGRVTDFGHRAGASPASRSPTRSSALPRSSPHPPGSRGRAARRFAVTGCGSASCTTSSGWPGIEFTPSPASWSTPSATRWRRRWRSISVNRRPARMETRSPPAHGDSRRAEGVRLDELAPGQRGVLLCVEPETPEILAQLAQVGMRPGVRLRREDRASSGQLRLQVAGRSARLTAETAQHVHVAVED